MDAPLGGPDAARAALLEAYYSALDSGDPAGLAEAAVKLPGGQYFGLHPGRIPALIHAAYAEATDPAQRCRLAAALARAWVYGGDAGQAVTFAEEALTLAGTVGRPAVTAEALDAALVARWGPDDFAVRVELAARLDSVAAHLVDPAPRLTAHLWRLTTAWECLDVAAVQRQLRALDLLAAETGAARYAFFAAARRAMHALVTGDLDGAATLIATARAHGAAAGEPDTDAVLHSLTAELARQQDDRATLGAEAEAYTAHGAAEGIPSVSAQAALLWLAADRPDRALDLLRQVTGVGLDTIARDVDFLLTVTALVEVAAALGETAVLDDGVRLLTPYAGRAVLNAGAVTFHGVVDEYLWRAEDALARDGSRWRHRAVSAYQRVGARWWHQRIAAPTSPIPARTVVVHLHRDAERGWLIGTAATALPDLKGLHYLRELVRHPGQEISALTLSAAVNGHTAVVEADTGEMVDAQALAAYRRRLTAIDTEIDQAGADERRLDRLQTERDALLAEVRAATGLGGRRRRFSDAHERARVAVRKAISAALDRMATTDPTLARLLTDTVHTGAACRYQPDPDRPITWLLDDR